MSEVILDIDNVDRLDIHFALGSELLIVNAGASETVCHTVDWASTSPLTRHATLLAVNGPSTVHRAPPIGLVNASSQNISVSAQAISEALTTVADAEMWTGNDEGMPELADVYLEGAQNSAAVWDLISSLMFYQHDPSGCISEELVQWAVKHSEPLASGLSGSLYEYAPLMLVVAGDCCTGLSIVRVAAVGSFLLYWIPHKTGASLWSLRSQIVAAGSCYSNCWPSEIQSAHCSCSMRTLR